MSKTRYAVVRDNVVYAYVEGDNFETRRWNLVYPIKDGKVSMDLVSVHPNKNESGTLSIERRVETIEFTLDIEKRLMTRDDGTEFHLVDEESLQNAL